MEQQLIEDLIKIRRQLHQNPELGFREIETSKLICRELETLKISYRSGIAQTGIIAQLKKGEGPCIALRADMDALPLEENTILEFKSRNKNVMHACGHDIHVTILLGALRLLEKEDFNGSVKFIFQPSERGAYDDFWKDRIYKSVGQQIVESGKLNDVEACLGLHVNPLLPKGKLAYCLGHVLAATGFFKIIITGKGGHAAFPELTVDPLLVATQIINDSQLIILRYFSASVPKVISFTMIKGGVNENIIPTEVEIQGTIRAIDTKTYDIIVVRLGEILKGIVLISKAIILISFNLSYPSLFNNKIIHEYLLEPCEKVFGLANVSETPPMMGGEDFSFYSVEKPFMFYFLGANDGFNKYFIYNPEVVFDEKCIKYGSEFLCQAALSLMKKC